MKYIIFLCLTAICSAVHAQTPISIPASTTVEAFSALTPGQYRFIGVTGTKDTTDIGLDKSLVCAPATACPPPIVCPVCPPQRSVIGLSYNPVTNQLTVTYSDNSTSIFTPTKTLFIQ